MAAHSYGTWTTTKEATEKEEGSKARTCAVCGYKQMESVPKLSSTKPVTPSTSSDDGNKTDVSGNNAPNVSGANTVTVTSPKTGDNPMTGLAVLLLLSVVSMSATVIASRKRRNL